jgi:putative inorganic carbon (hco3(-)) transporter
MGSAIGLAAGRRAPAAREHLGWAAAVLGAAALTAALLLWSIQAAVTGCAVFGLLALYATDRTVGATALLGFWWLVPSVRRIVQYDSGYVDSDPLSLAPFLATGGIVVLELSRARISPKATRVLACAALAFAIGLPVGLTAGPFAAVYALGGYLAALGLAVVGYGEARRGATPSLGGAAKLLLPLVALYAVVQSVWMPPWDQAWLDTVDITSIGVGEQDGAIRAFATLNAPGTLAGVLGVGLAWFLAQRRFGAGALIAAGLCLAALALTYVRGAWIALILAALAHALVTRGRSGTRILGAAVAMIVVVGALAGSNPAAGSLVTRISSLGSLNEDTSAQARVATPSAMLAEGVSAPFGHGSGTVGEASRLGGGESDLRYPDNAYLSLLVQSGPIGLLLMLAALAAILRSAWRLARTPSPHRAHAEACFAVLVFVLVFMVSGDHFYGAVGVAFWLVAGYVLGLERRAGDHVKAVNAQSGGSST